MSKKMKIIPALRFPEFDQDGEWTLRSIDELCDILNNIRKPVTSTNRTQGEYPYYGASGIIDYIDQYLFDERLLLIGEDGAKWGAFDNTAFLVEGKYWVNNHAHVLKPIGIDDKLLESYLVKLNLHPYITGAAPPKLTLRKLKEIPIPVPSTPEEQQKIAACLSSLDELIAAHNDKLDALKDHKKGLLQNLFPNNLNHDSKGFKDDHDLNRDKKSSHQANPINQGSDNVPKVRFPQFEDDGDWKIRPLEDVSKITTGNKDTQDRIDDGKYPFFVRSQTIERINSFSFDREAILTSGDGVGVGKIYHYIIGKFDLHQRVYCIYDFLKEVEGKFIFYFFSEHFYQRVMRMSAKNSVDSVRRSMLTEMPIALPPTKEEQQKIASCLAAVDALITAQQEKIEQLQQHKKGLMQGLFPKIES
jgi:type I restriction enzyme S subunit